MDVPTVDVHHMTVARVNSTDDVTRFTQLHFTCHFKHFILLITSGEVKWISVY